MTARSAPAFPVIHSVEDWLGRTLAWLYALVRWLPDSVQSHVVCAGTENLAEFPVEHLRCYGSGGGGVLPWVAARSWRYRLLRKRVLFRSIARGGAPVVVHSHFGSQGWYDRADVRSIGAAHVVSFYGYDVDRLPHVDPAWRDRYRRLFLDVDCVLCEGPAMVERVLALGCPEAKLRLHHLGVDVAAIAFQPLAWQRGEPLRVLMASTFREKKGVPYAVEALAAVGKHVPLEVTLVGDATLQERDQREKRRILATIDRCGLSQTIALRGFVSQAELLDLAYRHHVFVASSVTASDGDNEGGAPMVLPLLAATGISIVSTTHRDIPHVVQDGITGKLAGERDVAALASCIEWMAADTARRRAVAVAARQRVETEFNALLQGVKLAAIYRDAAAGRRSSAKDGDGCQ